MSSGLAVKKVNHGKRLLSPRRGGRLVAAQAHRFSEFYRSLAFVASSVDNSSTSEDRNPAFCQAQMCRGKRHGEGSSNEARREASAGKIDSLR